MQVQIETKPKGYEPKTLKITFETEEELGVFKDMLNCSIIVSEVIYAYPLNRRKLQHMLKAIHQTILEV